MDHFPTTRTKWGLSFIKCHLRMDKLMAYMTIFIILCFSSWENWYIRQTFICYFRLGRHFVMPTFVNWGVNLEQGNGSLHDFFVVSNFNLLHFLFMCKTKLSYFPIFGAPLGHFNIKTNFDFWTEMQLQLPWDVPRTEGCAFDQQLAFETNSIKLPVMSTNFQFIRPNSDISTSLTKVYLSFHLFWHFF